ncbi:MAG: YheT family hydrolase [Prochlorotrichaceae cyanobacterium]
MKVYRPPLLLQNPLMLTLAVAWGYQSRWLREHPRFLDSFRDHLFLGAEQVPLYGLYQIPNPATETPKGTVIATYGITGNLRDQGNLQVFADKALHAGYGVVLLDWRAHGETAKQSPTLTSDGLYEGLDFVHVAAQALALGCPPPFWFSGYSLGGQLALWGVKYAQDLSLLESLGLAPDTIAGGVVVCPNLDSQRSLTYLVRSFWGRYIEQSITRGLRQLAIEIRERYPESLDAAAVERATSIWSFDQELVISRLGFATVEEYYHASSPLPWLGDLDKPTWILYAAHDPLFDPALVPLLQAICDGHEKLDLCLTEQGGHIEYWSSQRCQAEWGDPDPWWAWNRAIEWLEKQRQILLTKGN